MTTPTTSTTTTITVVRRCVLWFTLILTLTATVCNAQNCGTSRRRPWRSLSCDEQETFLRACQDLKASGRWDELVLNHQRSGDWGHLVPAFLFWHRWLIWVAERELQRISGTCLTIPYWDWERSGSIETVFRPDTFGGISGRGCVQDGIARNWRVAENGGCLRREFDNRWRISRDVEVLNRITNFPEFGRFRVELEGAPHTNVHEWVGGPMADRWAVDDPTFFLHHCNVDRIFTLWQNYWGYPDLDLGELERQHYDGRVGDELVFRYVRQVSWMSPRTGDPPTIRELMKVNGNDAIMRYTYEDDNLAQQLVQTSSQFARTIDTSWNNPGRVSSNPRCTSQVNAGGIPNNDNNNDAQAPRVDFNENNNNNNNNGPPPQCRPRNAPCQRSAQCCSRRCRSGACRRRNNIRALQAEEEPEFMHDYSKNEPGEEEPEYMHQTPDFEDQQDRWYQLMDEFTPMFPNLIFAQLAAEDCQAAQQANGGQPLQVISDEWLTMHHVPQNATHAFECHSVPLAWNPLVEKANEEEANEEHLDFEENHGN